MGTVVGPGTGIAVTSDATAQKTELYWSKYKNYIILTPAVTDAVKLHIEFSHLPTEIKAADALASTNLQFDKSDALGLTFAICEQIAMLAGAGEQSERFRKLKEERMTKTKKRLLRNRWLKGTSIVPFTLG